MTRTNQDTPVSGRSPGDGANSDDEEIASGSEP